MISFQKYWEYVAKDRGKSPVREAMSVIQMENNIASITKGSWVYSEGKSKRTF